MSFSLKRWLKSVSGPNARGGARRPKPVRRPAALGIEALEDRTVPVNLNPIRTQLSGVLTSYQNNALDAQAYATNLPIVGQQLAANNAFKFASSFATGAQNAFNARTASFTDIEDALVAGFGLPGTSAIVATAVTGGTTSTISIPANPTPAQLAAANAAAAAADSIEFFFNKTGSLPTTALGFNSGRCRTCPSICPPPRLTSTSATACR